MMSGDPYYDGIHPMPKGQVINGIGICQWCHTQQTLDDQGICQECQTPQKEKKRKRVNIKKNFVKDNKQKELL